MRRRLLLANLAVIVTLLIVLDVPLALVYSRHEHDALLSSLQRDAAALSALSGEIIEHRGDHDVDALANRYSAEPGEIVAILDRTGTELTRPTIASNDPAFRAVEDAARSGRSSSGETDELTFVAIPLGDAGGAVLVARSDEAIDARVHRFWLILGAIGIGVLGVSLLVTTRIIQWVVEPLRRLDDKAAALGGGDLAARAATDEGPPEVVTLAVTFNEMAARLGELVRSQRRFVADASHQLRTPLTALRLRLESLDRSDPVAVESTRDAALEEVARLTRLVDGLLSLARAEGHRPGRVELDVSTIVTERHEAWAPLAAEQEVELRYVVDGAEPLTALLVPGHLEQILDNLIDNALDASPPGGAIVLRAARRGANVEIHVVDEGPGMSDEDRQRAFDPFWQSPSGGATGTTGLGLAIAEQLARACRGSISLESAAGGGLDAVIRVPVDATGA